MNPKDEIKERLSILDVASTYVRLEKAGGQYRARCPFHNERTPSFYVSPERKSFHCFGCGAHGDIFTFVEKLENVPFFEALKILADRAGVTLTTNKDSQEQSRLVALLKDATQYFESNLKTSGEAQEYISSRGISEDSTSLFHIGYAKNEWRTLFAHLAEKGYSPEEMEHAGVVIRALDDKGNVKGWYDRFRGRVMFPVRNIAGVTVGYSGRILPSLVEETKEQAKYVNTPETLLYHKSKILFGYDTAKKMMNEKKICVVVEGQMDLVMSYQSGVHNTVAVSGTAFTDEHIALIKRFADKVVLSFDTDNAGQTALKKSALLCLYGGLDVLVTQDIGTKDPADLVKEDPNKWAHAVDHAVPLVSYLLTHVMKSSTDEREVGRRVVVEILPFVRAISGSIDRAYFIKEISKKTGISDDALLEEMKRGLSVIQEELVQTPPVPRIPLKEKLERELIALIKWQKKEEDEEVKKINLPYDMYPHDVIESSIFELEKVVRADPERVLRELISSYKKELYREELAKLHARLREEKDHEDQILKEIHELTKADFRQ